MAKFKVGDIVKHKGYAAGAGEGGRFIVFEVLDHKDDPMEYDYRLHFLHTYNQSWDTTGWNEAADRREEAKEWEDKLEYDTAYIRNIKLNQLGI